MRAIPYRDHAKDLSRVLTAIVAVFLVIIPLSTRGEEMENPVYSIQISSYRTLEIAQKDFSRIISKLPAEKLDYFRVETVGEYFALRLGKFPGQTSAAEFLKSLENDLPGAIIVETNYVQERIRLMYRAGTTAEVEREEQEKDLVLPDREVTPEAVPEEQSLSPAPGEEEEKAPVPRQEEARSRPAPEEPQQEWGQPAGSPSVGLEESPVETAPPEELPAKLALIENLVMKKNFPAALQVIGQEVTERPDHPGLNSWYGMVLLKTGKPEEAMFYLTKAAALSPAEPDYHSAAGYCNFYLGEYALAADAFDRALALEPAHVDALAGLGIVRVRQEDKVRARAIYDRLKELDSASALNLLRLIEGEY